MEDITNFRTPDSLILKNHLPAVDRPISGEALVPVSAKSLEVPNRVRGTVVDTAPNSV